MRYHIILNGFSEYLKEQLLEIKGFIDTFCFDIACGKTIIVCRNDSDLNFLSSLTFTKEVIFLQMPFYHAETALHYLCDSIDENDIYIHGYDNFAHETAVRLSARKNSSSVVDITNINIDSGELFVKKMIYSNHMEGTFKLKKAPYFVTISKGLFCGTIKENNIDKTICAINCKLENAPIDITIEKQQKKETLSNAKVIIAAGRGVKNKENVLELEHIADSMNGMLAVSRPVAMSAWAPMEKLVGVSGTLAKPELCITAGVSGAAAFFAGIEKSDFIVSINTDEKAPIVKKSNVVIIDDYKEIMKELAICINREKEDF